MSQSYGREPVCISFLMLDVRCVALLLPQILGICIEKSQIWENNAAGVLTTSEYWAKNVSCWFSMMRLLTRMLVFFVEALLLYKQRSTHRRGGIIRVYFRFSREYVALPTRTRKLSTLEILFRD